MESDGQHTDTDLQSLQAESSRPSLDGSLKRQLNFSLAQEEVQVPDAPQYPADEVMDEEEQLYDQ
jgi:hypothetical protein